MYTRTGSNIRWHNGNLQYAATVIVDQIPVRSEWVDVPTVDDSSYSNKVSSNIKDLIEQVEILKSIIYNK